MLPLESVANNMGVDCAKQGHYEDAISHFLAAVAHNDTYLPGYKNLLAACVETGQWEKALKAAAKCEELHPLVPELSPLVCAANRCAPGRYYRRSGCSAGLWSRL